MNPSKSFTEIRSCRDRLERGRFKLEGELLVQFPHDPDERTRRLAEYDIALNDVQVRTLESIKKVFDDNDAAVQNVLSDLKIANEGLKKALASIKKFVADMSTASKVMELVKKLADFGKAK